jgi:hypothetical protein
MVFELFYKRPFLCRILYNSNACYHIHKSPPPAPVGSQTSPARNLTQFFYYQFKYHYNIYKYIPQAVFPLQVLWLKFRMHFSFIPCATFPAHLFKRIKQLETKTQKPNLSFVWYFLHTRHYGYTTMTRSSDFRFWWRDNNVGNKAEETYIPHIIRYSPVHTTACNIEI